MKARSKSRRWTESPAACLMSQLRSDAVGRRDRRGRKKYYESESPGKLYTYVSAGNIETPGDEFLNEPVVRRGVGPVVLLAVLLVLIWLIY